MSTTMRLILSPKCITPRSPINKQIGRSVILQPKYGSDKQNSFARKLEFLVSPSKSNVTKLNANNRDCNDKANISGKANLLTVPDVRKYESNIVRQSLLVNTPQKLNILKNGLTESDLNVLGRGSFGIVIRGVYKNQDVAVKVIKYDPEKKLRESNILGVAHENIVKTLDIITNENHKYAMVIMEYLEDSSHLQSILNEKRFKMDTEHVAKFALDICKGLSYCHENNILHLDVKPSNVLVFANGRCKLCDFGNCYKINDDTEPYLHEGTIAYTAPEILTGEIPTAKSDVYSFGILLWQMVYRQNPYYSIDRSEIIIYKVVKFGLRPKCTLGVSEDNFRGLYTQCWSTLPQDRPDVVPVINMLSLY